MITAYVIDFTIHQPSARQKTVFRGLRIQRNLVFPEARIVEA